MRLKAKQSWYTAINSASCNADVVRAPEKEVVENFVAYLRSALLFFPGVDHVLAGPCSNSVDLPALDHLATKYCNYSIESHFIIFDTRATFSEEYNGLGTYKLQNLLGYEADGGNMNAMALRDRKSAHFSAAFDAEVTAFLYFIGEVTGFQHSFPLVCFILLSLNSFPTLVRL
jgi:hypothetical protein